MQKIIIFCCLFLLGLFAREIFGWNQEIFSIQLLFNSRALIKNKNDHKMIGNTFRYNFNLIVYKKINLVILIFVFFSKSVLEFLLLF